jgi:hypothetical protein
MVSSFTVGNICTLKGIQVIPIHQWSQRILARIHKGIGPFHIIMELVVGAVVVTFAADVVLGMEQRRHLPIGGLVIDFEYSK